MVITPPAVIIILIISGCVSLSALAVAILSYLKADLAEIITHAVVDRTPPEPIKSQVKTPPEPVQEEFTPGVYYMTDKHQADLEDKLDV